MIMIADDYLFLTMMDNVGNPVINHNQPTIWGWYLPIYSDMLGWLSIAGVLFTTLIIFWCFLILKKDQYDLNIAIIQY